MTSLENLPTSVVVNYYQTLSVPSTATLVEIRNAYENILEEAHLEALVAYSLLPEEEVELKLLQFGHAFLTLANPVARAKYDDQLKKQTISAKQANFQQKSSPISEPLLAEKTIVKITETSPLPHKAKNKQTAEKLELTKSAPKEVVGQTQEERQNFYLNLAVKNELTEENVEDYYSKLKAYNTKISYNGAVLNQIRELKSITLDELAKITCIRITYLKAIEEEDFKIFTSAIYL